MLITGKTVLILGILIGAFTLVMVPLIISSTPMITPMECINMNGHEITPNPELCKAACSATSSNPHMQAHYDETCGCCIARNINYTQAGEYQERVYVVNSDGSRGEDRTCAYFPDAKGCEK